MVKLFSQVVVIARIEAQFYRRYPKLLIATLAVALIPALYAVIYLSSVWDPAARTGNLAVALVNQDQGMVYREQSFNVGTDVIAKLKARHTFGYRDMSNEHEARDLVGQGKLAFALIIPSDFSSNAIPGSRPGGGRLVVYTSEGNSYQSSGLARRFAEDLGHEVNESLNEQRWSLVLTNAVGSQRSLDRLRDGVSQLRKGAKELASGSMQTASGAETVAAGARKLGQNVGQLAGGVKEIGGGLRSMDAKRPRNGDLNRLKAGAEALASGHGEFAAGLLTLKDGTQSLSEGVNVARTEVKSSLFASAKAAQGVDQLAEGLTQLDNGLQTAMNAQKKLSEGADRVSAGVATLTGGVQSLTGGIRKVVTRLPEDSQMDELVSGATRLTAASGGLSEGMRKVREGAQHLATGLDLLADSLPATVPKMDGSAQGLANSVQPVVEVDAQVQNNGGGFAPNIIPAALWLGAGIAAFLIHVRVLPRQALFFYRPAQMLGKIAIPAVVVLLQALLVLLLVTVVLKMPVNNLGAFALTLGAASMTFLLIVFALTRAFGDAGKALALVFLAVQLSSSGGVIPVELSGALFADISPWLPMTWVVRAIKATLFGAFDGAWQLPLQQVAAAGLAAAVMACYVGRWRFVKQSSMRPAVEF